MWPSKFYKPYKLTALFRYEVIATGGLLQLAIVVYLVALLTSLLVGTDGYLAERNKEIKLIDWLIDLIIIDTYRGRPGNIWIT